MNPKALVPSVGMIIKVAVVLVVINTLANRVPVLKKIQTGF